MKIAYVKIENFRGIRSLHIECGARVNVFAGENGAGKSTVIDALRFLLSWMIARIKNMKGRGSTLLDSDISRDADYCLLEIGLDSGVRWRLVKQKSTGRQKLQQITNLQEMTEYANMIVTEYEKQHDTCQLPIFANYGVNRSVTEVPLRLHKTHELSPLSVYNSQLENVVRFRTFFEWYRERDDIDNANYRYEPHYKADKQLNAVKRAVEAVMPGYSNLRVKRNPTAMLLEKDGVAFNIKELSDGEKCYFSLVADIARQLAMANPGLDNPLNGQGEILIDEIDLHLHPQWQSEVMTRLTEIFPNCQFFLTTHSPFVVSNINPSERDKFFLMRRGEAVEVYSNTYGLRVDEILTEFFHISSLRNMEVQKRIDEIWHCLAKGEDKTQTFLDALGWLREHLDPSDIEFARINLEKMKLKKAQA